MIGCHQRYESTQQITYSGESAQWKLEHHQHESVEFGFPCFIRSVRMWRDVTINVGLNPSPPHHCQIIPLSRLVRNLAAFSCRLLTINHVLHQVYPTNNSLPTSYRRPIFPNEHPHRPPQRSPTNGVKADGDRRSYDLQHYPCKFYPRTRSVEDPPTGIGGGDGRSPPPN